MPLPSSVKVKESPRSSSEVRGLFASGEGAQETPD